MIAPLWEIEDRAQASPSTDTQIALDGVAEHFQRRLIARAVVRRRRFFDAVELDQHDTLFDAFFVGLGGGAASQEASAGAGNRGPGELVVPSAGGSE